MAGTCSPYNDLPALEMFGSWIHHSIIHVWLVSSVLSSEAFSTNTVDPDQTAGYLYLHCSIKLATT